MFCHQMKNKTTRFFELFENQIDTRLELNNHKISTAEFARTGSFMAFYFVKYFLISFSIKLFFKKHRFLTPLQLKIQQLCPVPEL